MKTFVFLDVDQTLLYDDRVINVTLLDALKNQGIKDIYLFTNMSMREIKYIGVKDAPMTRHELIDILKKKGITVHGVITPPDPFYKDKNGKLYPVGSAYNNLYEQTYRQLQRNPIMNSDNTLNPRLTVEDEADYYLRKYEWDKASHIALKTCELDKDKTIDIPQLCISYNGSEVICPDKESLVRELVHMRRDKVEDYTVDFSQRAVSGKVSLKKSFSDNKALMMDVAIRELTEKHGDISILFADDTKVHLEGAKKAVNQFNSRGFKQVLLSTLEMKREFEQATNPEANNDYKKAIAQFKFKNQLELFKNELEEKMGHAEYGFKYSEALRCYTKLVSLSDDYFNGKIEYDTFKKDSNTAIDSVRPALSEHRGCKEIVGNIALAIAGLGVLYIVGGLFNFAMTGNFFFKFKTDSEEKLDKLKESCRYIAS